MQITQVSRRDALKGAVAVPMASLLGGTFVGVRGAAAAVDAAAITALTSVASLTLGMFEKSNANARDMARLNVQLDTMIALQKATLTGIGTIVAQLERLAILIPGMLQAQRAQEIQEDIVGISDSLVGLPTRIKDAVRSGSDNLDEVNSKVMEEYANKALEFVLRLAGHVDTTEPDDEHGFYSLQYVNMAAFSANLIVPTMYAIDAELRLKGVSVASRTARYREINAALQRACRRISEFSYAGLQIRFQEFHRNNAFALGTPGVVQDWNRKVAFPGPETFDNVTRRFVTHQAWRGIPLGQTVTHREMMTNPDFAPYRDLPFLLYKYWVDVRFWGILAFHRGPNGYVHYGVRDFNFSVEGLNRELVELIAPKDLPSGPFGRNGREALLPLHSDLSGEYALFAGNEAQAFSSAFIHVRDYHAKALEALLRDQFKTRKLDYTGRNVRRANAEEIQKWHRQNVAYLEAMQNVL